MNESFDFNKVKDNKPSIAGIIKKTAITLIEENVLPLFNNLRPDYKERYRFIPEHRFIGNKCELLYQNKVIIDFTFGYDYIEEMNVYDTTRLTVVGYNGYILDVSVIFYVVRQIPMPINTLNFCYDSSKYPAYKFEGDIAHDEMRDLTRIMEDYTDSLPEHIIFNSKYIDLYNLRFENETAIKKFLYKIRKDNGEQKYEIKQCIFITETPPEFRGLLNTPRSKGTTSKLIRKYIKAPVNSLLERFDFDTVNNKKNSINVANIILNIFYRINNHAHLTLDDYNILTLYTGIYKIKNVKELQDLIIYFIDLFGNKCNLNWMDVSNITKMVDLFYDSKFNGDISKWDVRNVINMSGMFSGSKFNGDISKWDVSNVKNMSFMFSETDFNKDISKWDVSNVKKMQGMFLFSSFNKDISLWNVGKVNDMENLFRNSEFNGDISHWDVSKVTNMRYMFCDSNFNGDISQWNTGKVTDMEYMFENSEFTGDISNWNVSNVTDMNCMFRGSNFNGDISKWNVSNVTDMRWMFKDSKFNKDISQWNISTDAIIKNMFDKCKIKNIYKPKKKKKLEEGFDFDTVNKEKKKINIYQRFHRIIELPYSKLTLEDKSFIKSFKDSMPTIKVKNRKELGTLLSNIIKILGNKCNLNWIDVSSITDMGYLFARTKFNGDISNWDVSNVTIMSAMFLRSHFSGDISKWNVSNVERMEYMFANSYFNGDISNWDVSNVTNMYHMFYQSNFNGDISKWNVSNVTNMYQMFYQSNFNGDISNWNVSNVERMLQMFYCSPFNLDISQWKIKPHCTRAGMFDACPINNEYRPKIFQKRKKLEEGFDFDSIDKKKILPSLSIKDKVLLFDNFLKDLYDKHILTGMQYGNKYFSDAWSKAKTDLEFNGTYYKCEADGDHLNVELNYMNLYFQSPEDYNQFCEDIKIFKDIRINGLLSIYMKTLSLRMQRLENFGELGKTITFVKELDINNLILHDFEGMPEVKSFKANNSTIFTFNGFKYKDAVKDIELYYKPGQHCVIDWTGFPKKLYGIFSYKLNIDSDSLAAYTMAFERQLTTLSGFPDDFMYISDPENVMHVGQPNFVDINMEKWQRDKIKLHIMDLLLQSFPNKQKRDKLYKRLTKIYRYR